MTNHERLKELNEEEFTHWLMQNWETIKRRWTSTKLGMIDWLKSENYRPCDFCRSLTCDNNCDYIKAFKNYDNYSHYIDLINEQPSVDAVEVVMCRDCKYSKERETNGFCCKWGEKE